MREPKPVIRAEVTEKNRTVRIIAAIVLLVIGAVAITSGIMSLLNKDTGWQTVEISPQERSCSESFILQYNFAGSGAEASAVNKKLEAAYAQAAVKAYQLFTPDEEIPGVNNVYYVNHNPNEEITVDPVLYDAFAKLEGTRYLFMGPIYAHYTGLILNASQEYAAQLDPAQDTDSAALMQTLAEFANDPQTVNLELLGDNRIKLSVSDAYLAFLEEEEIEPTFLDFSYMTNAFIIDYLAEVLQSQDLTDGYLVSVDGYTRNLCQDGTFYFNIFDRVGETVYPAATMEYQGPISMVYLKDYPTADSDVNYRVVDDHFVHLMADPVDGMYRTAEENLVSYSYDTGCVDVLLKMLPGFVTQEFSVPEGVFSVWCEEEMVLYNDDTISMKNLLKTDEMSYRAVLKQ